MDRVRIPITRLIQDILGDTFRTSALTRSADSVGRVDETALDLAPFTFPAAGCSLSYFPSLSGALGFCVSHVGWFGGVTRRKSERVGGDSSAEMR